ncbi:MAG: ABC transporter ATP-binding protein [Eubacterium sp.]
MIILETKGLTKRFGNSLALDNVDITLECGKIVGLLGPNGSGKTTFLKLLNGLLKPDHGSIMIGGEAPGIITKQHVSFLPDSNYFPKWMKVTQLLEYFEDFYDDFECEKANYMLAKLDIDSKMKLSHMSKGTLEKVQLILAMSRNANLYCLDEPIGGVDPATRDYILNTIVSNYCENSTVLISTHLIADVENVLDEVIFLQNGQVRLQSSVDDIREKENKSVDALFREVFKC